jgi:hypothetical protein
MKFETFRRSASVTRDDGGITIITRPTLGGQLVATLPFAILANALTGIVARWYGDRVSEEAMGWLALVEWPVVFLALAHLLKRTFVFDRRSGVVLTNLPNLTRVPLVKNITTAFQRCGYTSLTAVLIAFTLRISVK